MHLREASETLQGRPCGFFENEKNKEEREEGEGREGYTTRTRIMQITRLPLFLFFYETARGLSMSGQHMVLALHGFFFLLVSQRNEKKIQ